MACDHKRSHLGVDFGNFQQYLCMHSTHKNAVCYYSLEIISLIWLPIAANYAMQCCAMDVQYIVYQYSIHMYCVKFTLCPRDLVLARKQIASMLESKIFQAYNPFFFQIELTLSLKAITKGSSSYHLCFEYFPQIFSILD